MQLNCVQMAIMSERGKVMYLIKLKKILYGMKQVGNKWYNTLHEGLGNHGFVSSIIVKCYSTVRDQSL